MNTLVDFGTAVNATKQGKRISRKGWNGKGMFVFQRPADTLNVGFIVEKVKSLPQSVKDYFLDTQSNHDTVTFGPYLCMLAADGSIVNGWLASQTDILAEDWQILD